jgi:hypothetical protein
MPPPIIFFHQGFEPYLAFTLWQARRTNPQSYICLLGDDTNDLSSIGARHARFRDHPGRAAEFIAAYHHLSGHEMECERLCFERWFYLDAFLEHEGINEFYFLDSDFFLLRDLEELRPTWSAVEMAGAPAYAFAWYKSRHIITRFCDFMLERFRDEAQVARWRNTYDAGLDFSPPEGILNVSDMLLWMMFIQQDRVSHLDLRVPRDGSVFDNWFDQSNGFRMRGGSKELTDRDGKFFGLYEKTNERVRFAGLHLGGKLAKRLGPFFTGWPAPLVRACCRPNYRRNLRRLFLIAVRYCRSGRPYLPAHFERNPGHDSGAASR